MREWVKRHGLSLALVSVYVMLQVGNVLTAKHPFSGEWWNGIFMGHLDGTFGAILLVIFTKFFIEKGSSESN